MSNHTYITHKGQIGQYIKQENGLYVINHPSYLVEVPPSAQIQRKNSSVKIKLA